MSSAGTIGGATQFLLFDDVWEQSTVKNVYFYVSVSENMHGLTFPKIVNFSLKLEYQQKLRHIIHLETLHF